MGPSDTVQSPGSADQGRTCRKCGTAQLQVAKPPRPFGEMTSRRCGRYFPVDVSASPQAKWWACPACHLRLFGTE
jgi:hypothetical protein